MFNPKLAAVLAATLLLGACGGAPSGGTTLEKQYMATQPAKPPAPAVAAMPASMPAQQQAQAKTYPRCTAAVRDNCMQGAMVAARPTTKPKAAAPAKPLVVPAKPK